MAKITGKIGIRLFVEFVKKIRLFFGLAIDFFLVYVRRLFVALPFFNIGVHSSLLLPLVNSR
jgi:hypothetical protein